MATQERLACPAQLPDLPAPAPLVEFARQILEEADVDLAATLSYPYGTDGTLVFTAVHVPGGWRDIQG